MTHSQNAATPTLINRDLSVEAENLAARSQILANAIQNYGLDIANISDHTRVITTRKTAITKDIRAKYATEGGEHFQKTLAAQDRASAQDAAENEELVTLEAELQQHYFRKEQTESILSGVKAEHAGVVARLRQIGYQQNLNAARLDYATAKLEPRRTTTINLNT